MSARQNRIRAERAAKRALKALTNNETLPVAVAAQQQPISAPLSAPEPTPVPLSSSAAAASAMAVASPEPSTKPNVSAAQWAANRANAQLSSGPSLRKTAPPTAWPATTAPSASSPPNLKMASKR